MKVRIKMMLKRSPPLMARFKEKKAKTISSALRGLEKKLNGPRGAQKELESMTFPQEDRRFFIIVDALKAVRFSVVANSFQSWKTNHHLRAGWVGLTSGG